MRRKEVTRVFKPVSRSDSIRLQQQLEEVQIQFVALQNKTADYECVQAELKEKKVQLVITEPISPLWILSFITLLPNSENTYLRSGDAFQVALKAHVQMVEDFERQKQENDKIAAE